MVQAHAPLWDRLFTLGVTFRSGPERLREGLSQAAAAPERLAMRLSGCGIREWLVLNTCDRVELVGLAPQPEAASKAALGCLAGAVGLSADALEPMAEESRSEAALNRLFAIAAGLESQVIGEPEILGQMRDAQEQARAEGALGPDLERIVAAALRAGRRVRSEASIGEAPVSITAASRRVARSLHGDLEDATLLLIGLGELGEILAGELRATGRLSLLVAHRSEAQALAAARRLEAQSVAMDRLEEALPLADIVVLAAGTGRAQLSRKAVRKAIKARRNRPMLLLDLSIPSDLEPDVDTLDEAFVYRLEDLERLAIDGRSSRRQAVQGAWSILAEEQARFMQQQSERAATPAVVELRRHAEALRQDVIADRSLSADEATALLVKRLLHRPSVALRQAAAEDPSLAERQADLLQTLFGLADRHDKRNGEET